MVTLHLSGLGDLESLFNALTGLVLVTHRVSFKENTAPEWSGGAGMIATTNFYVQTGGIRPKNVKT